MSPLYHLLQTVSLGQMVQLPMATNRDPVVHLDMEQGPVWSSSANYTKMAARFCPYLAMLCLSVHVKR